MKKKRLKFAVISTIRYKDTRRKLRGDMTGPSLEAIAKRLSSITEYWMANDQEIHGAAKSVQFSFRPLLSTASKAKKKA